MQLLECVIPKAGHTPGRLTFYTKIVSGGSVGSFRSLGFDENVHLNSNRATKIVVCAPDLRLIYKTRLVVCDYQSIA